MSTSDSPWHTRAYVFLWLSNHTGNYRTFKELFCDLDLWGSVLRAAAKKTNSKKFTIKKKYNNVIGAKQVENHRDESN